MQFSKAGSHEHQHNFRPSTRHRTVYTSTPLFHPLTQPNLFIPPHTHAQAPNPEPEPKTSTPSPPVNNFHFDVHVYMNGSTDNHNHDHESDTDETLDKMAKTAKYTNIM